MAVNIGAGSLAVPGRSPTPVSPCPFHQCFSLSPGRGYVEPSGGSPAGDAYGGAPYRRAAPSSRPAADAPEGMSHAERVRKQAEERRLAEMREREAALQQARREVRLLG